MSRPCGLVLAAQDIPPEAVTQALEDQGGPQWDKTVFRVLKGVDVRSLVSGRPVAGTGTGVSVASSGWWLRNIDDFADRLSSLTGVPILSAFEAEAGPAAASGYHLARPNGTHRRKLGLGTARCWAEGVSELVGADLDADEVEALPQAARAVHGDDPVGSQLPGLFNFSLDEASPAERAVLTEVRGAALTEGLRWCPPQSVNSRSEPPSRMRVIVLKSAVRLPGPPRWARATRAEALHTAQEVVQDDGWVCLVPKIDDVIALYGAAVRVLQLAPLPDGSYLGVLHPRAGVRVGDIRRQLAEVTEVVQEQVPDREAFHRALDRVIERLKETRQHVVWDESELRASEDPAALLGWQIEVSPELCQTYLAATHATRRLDVIASALATAPLR